MAYTTNNVITKLLRKRYGRNIPIVDAKVPLRIQPMPCDAKGADPKSIDNCLLVHTCQRQFGSISAVFFKTTAYVDLLSDQGERRLERHILDATAKKVAGAFDRGVPFKIGCAVVLKVPKGGNTLKNLRKQKGEYNKTPAGQAYYEIGREMQKVKRAKAVVERIKTEVSDRKPGDRTVKFRVRDAKVRLAEAETNLERARRKAAKIKKFLGRPAHKSPQFDLTTRNGAIGNYHFVAAS